MRGEAPPPSDAVAALAELIRLKNLQASDSGEYEAEKYRGRVDDAWTVARQTILHAEGGAA